MSLINDNTYGDYNIKLKALEKEYDVLLTQYLETKNAYIEALQEKNKGIRNYSINDKTSINGVVYKTIENVSDVEKCKALCSENKCDGAVYNSTNKKCNFHNINLGKFQLNTNQKTSSIVINYIEKLKKLSTIIGNLLIINNQIIQVIENLDPSYVKDIELKKQRSKELYENYKKLVNERDNVNKQLNDYNTLVQTYTEQNTGASKNYMVMNLLIFLIIFLILFGLKELFSIPINLLPIFIFSCVFFLSLNLDNAYGFLTWLGVIGILLFLYFINVL